MSKREYQPVLLLMSVSTLQTGLEATYDGESWKENDVDTGSTLLKISTVISKRNFKGAMQGHGVAVYTLVCSTLAMDARRLTVI